MDEKVFDFYSAGLCNPPWPTSDLMIVSFFFNVAWGGEMCEEEINFFEERIFWV